MFKEWKKKNKGRISKEWNSCELLTTKKIGYIGYNITAQKWTQHCTVSIPQDFRRRSLKVHQISYFAEGGQWYDTGTQDISHLCGNPNCTFSKHFLVEEKKANGSRKSCQTYSIDCDECKMTHFYTDCSHNPKCCKSVSKKYLNGTTLHLCHCGKKVHNLEQSPGLYLGCKVSLLDFFLIPCRNGIR
jgi:hypothetical protein